MWRMVETLQNNSTIGFYKNRHIQSQDYVSQKERVDDEQIINVDYL